MKIPLAKYPEEQKQVDDLRTQQLDIITAWVAGQDNPPEGLIELEAQKTAIAVNIKPVKIILKEE